MTLSPRERQVADLRAAGLGYLAIGIRLGISPKTVSENLKKVYVKLNLDKQAHNGRAEMLKNALAGLVLILLLCGWHIPVLQHPAAGKARDVKGDLVVIDYRHGDRHTWTPEAQQEYQHYLSQAHHMPHARYALRIEDADPAELKAYCDWLHAQGERSPFKNRY